MVGDLFDKQPKTGKVDLKFYDVLDDPAFYPAKDKADDSGEITPGPETGETASIKPTQNSSTDEKIPVKHSRKLATWYQDGQAFDAESVPALPPKKNVSLKVKTDKKADEKPTKSGFAPKVLKSKIPTEKDSDAVSKESKSDTGKASIPAQDHDVYTIQIASYKNLDDALSHMVLLDKKGVTAYRASVKINGETWYRVRTGSFADYKTAGAQLTKLAGSGVKGMVIKKE